MAHLATTILGDIVTKVRPATETEDIQEVTDLAIELDDGSSVPVGVRELSRPEFRDCTIRVVNEGAVTEWDKVKAGKGRWYLYTWRTGRGHERDFALLDLDRMRACGLFDGKCDEAPWGLIPHDVTTQATKVNFFVLHNRCPECVIACHVTEHRDSAIADILLAEHGPPERVSIPPKYHGEKILQ